PQAGTRRELRHPRPQALRQIADRPQEVSMTVLIASEIVTRLFWTSVVAGGLLAGLPLMFTALGETIAERAGVLNIGLEGMMLVGAYVGFLGAHYSGSQWAGYAAG